MMLSSVLFFSPHVNRTSFLALTEAMRSGLASNEEEFTFTPWKEGGTDRWREGWREGENGGREVQREGGRREGRRHASLSQQVTASFAPMSTHQ